MSDILTNLASISIGQIIMWIIGGVLIYLAIKKDMEPTLLLPIGFGAILVNIPFSGAVGSEGALTTLYNAGIANELFPLILFIGIGAMIDFGPILTNPKLMIFRIVCLAKPPQPSLMGILFPRRLTSTKTAEASWDKTVATAAPATPI